MKLRRLSTLNYCQHKGERTWQFTGSVIGVVGPNGSGKSNLVKAIEFAVTGSLERKRARTLTFGAKKGHVALELEIRPGLIVTIHRDLHRESAELTFSDGRETVTGASKVNAALLELLETDKTLLEQIVFVNQDSIAALLFAPASEKDRLASRFFGLERAVAIERTLSEEIAAIQLTPVHGTHAERAADLATTESELARVTAELAELRQQLGSQANDLPARREALSAFWIDRNARERSRACAAEHVRVATTLTALAERRDALTNNIAKYPIVRVRELYVRESERRRVSELRRGLVGRRDKFAGARETLQADEPELTARGQTMRERKRWIEDAERYEHVSESESAAQSLLVDGVERLGKSTCPICLTTLEAGLDDAQVATIRERVAGQPTYDPAAARQLIRARQELQEIHDDLMRYQTRMRDNAAELATLDAEIEALGPDQGPGEPEKWDKAIRAYDDLRQELARTEREHDFCMAELVALPPVEGPGVPVDDHYDPVTEQSWIEDVAGQLNAVNAAQVNVRHLSETAGWKRDELARFIAIEEENARLSARRQTLLNLRRTFHPAGAPAELVERRIQRLEEGINGFLQSLSMPFRARAGDGFNFEYVFDDDPDHPRTAIELSGGQRVAMSIAFRLAALSSFSASVGLLVLDEPSAAMDAERVELFAELLRSLEAMAERLQLTFLFVTHAEPLMASFNQTVRLTPSQNEP